MFIFKINFNYLVLVFLGILLVNKLLCEFVVFRIFFLFFGGWFGVILFFCVWYSFRWRFFYFFVVGYWFGVGFWGIEVVGFVGELNVLVFCNFFLIIFVVFVVGSNLVFIKFMLKIKKKGF